MHVLCTLAYLVCVLVCVCCVMWVYLLCVPVDCFVWFVVLLGCVLTVVFSVICACFLQHTCVYCVMCVFCLVRRGGSRGSGEDSQYSQTRVNPWLRQKEDRP